MAIAFRKFGGRVADLRLVDDAYAAVAGETVVAGDALPDPSTLLSAAEQLVAAREMRSAALAAACGDAIRGGFSSRALGSVFTYPSVQTDQDNLAASVLASLLPQNQAAGWTTVFMCADPSGNWARRPHTAAQIQQVGEDGKAFVIGCLQRLDALRVAIAAAATVADVEAIVW